MLHCQLFLLLLLAVLNDVEWDVKSQSKSSMHPPLARPLHFVNISFSALFWQLLSQCFLPSKTACGRIVCLCVCEWQISSLFPFCHPRSAVQFISVDAFLLAVLFSDTRSLETETRHSVAAVNGVAFLLSCCCSFCSPSPVLLLDWLKFTTY